MTGVISALVTRPTSIKPLVGTRKPEVEAASTKQTFLPLA